MTTRIDLPAERATRRTGRARAMRLNWLHGLSSFCWGMVYPYTAIYLAREPGVGTAGAGMYFAGAGVANVAVALILAVGWWRPRRTRLGLIGNALSVVGYASIPLVGNELSALLAGIMIGLGQGCFMAAIVPTVNALIHPDDRREVFAVRYAILNGTLAAGAMTTGIATMLVSPERLLGWLFPVTAAGYLPLMMAQYAVRGAVAEQARDAGPDPGGPSPADGGVGPAVEHGPARPWSPVRLLRACAGVVAFQLVAYLVGFSQFESTAPLTVDRLLGVPLVWVSVMLGVNTASIVLFQSQVTRRLAPYSIRTGLRAALVLWALGYAVVAATSFGNQSVVVAGLLGFALIFALGECAYSSTFHPWLASIVPDGELTRATALANSTMGAGMFAGPLLGVGLISTGSAVLVWATLGVVALVGLSVIRGTPSAREHLEAS